MPWSSLVAQMVKNLPAMQETWIWSLGREDPLEKGMATHFSILAWRIPWTEKPGGLQSVGSQRVRHDLATTITKIHIGEGNGNPLHCSCLENPRDGGAWWTDVHGVAQSRTRLTWLSRSSSGSDGKEPACNERDLSYISGSGRLLAEGNGNPLQYSCLENSMDRGTWWAAVHRVTNSWTWLSN